MAILALKQLNLTKNDETGCFEVEVTDYDWYDYEGLQDIFFMDEHTAVATLVLCRRERIGDHMAAALEVGQLNEEKDVTHLISCVIAWPRP